MPHNHLNKCILHIKEIFFVTQLEPVVNRLVAEKTFLYAELDSFVRKESGKAAGKTLLKILLQGDHHLPHRRLCRLGCTQAEDVLPFFEISINN